MTSALTDSADISSLGLARALDRFRALRPYLEDSIPLSQIASKHGVALRTAKRWVQRYRTHGLDGLDRKSRADKSKRRIGVAMLQLIEGLALQKPKLSAATIHRKVAGIAAARGEQPPSYSSVYAIIRQIDPGLLTMAHEGSKAYADTFDLVHRTEARGPNAIWQADHTLLDVWVLDEKGQPGKPWLTIVLDDYSRAVAGYFLSFSAPSAMQTALALRQAIWRKPQPAWHVCGIPGVLYTDHGCDFTSRHIEQVAAALKIRLIFSTAGRPQGRGKIERFFSTVGQMFLSQLPGYAPSGASGTATLHLPQLAVAFETFLIEEYHRRPHTSTSQLPQERWEAGGFLPQMPGSLEQLDLLLLTVPKSRRVQQDGIRFQGYRFISPTLAAYVGEEVLLRYDPRDIGEIRVFHRGLFLCRAICPDLAGETVSLREVISARTRRWRHLRQTLRERQRTVESLLELRRGTGNGEPNTDRQATSTPAEPKLKRYLDE